MQAGTGVSTVWIGAIGRSAWLGTSCQQAQSNAQHLQ